MVAVSIAEAQEAIARRLGAVAAQHSEAVATTAALLAERYDVDIESARLAGLLHDWAREDGDSKLLQDAIQAGMDVDSVDEAVPYLLHARIGAASLREEFPGISEDVVLAVARHTLGDVEMTDLDRVVYVADMIEPGRTYKGVEKLRAAVGEVSLAELFARAYARSLKHVIRKRKRLHPAAVEVWNTIADNAALEESGDQ